MSRLESRDDDRDSPERARALLTVRAAISSARPFDTPRSRSESRMWRYCRSRLGEDPRGMRGLLLPGLTVSLRYPAPRLVETTPRAVSRSSGGVRAATYPPGGPF